MSIICPNCGTVNDDETSFCHNCGGILHKEEPIKPVAPVKPKKTMNNISDLKIPAENFLKKKNNDIAVLLSLFIPGLGYLYLKNDDKFFIYFMSALISIITYCIVSYIVKNILIDFILILLIIIFWVYQLIIISESTKENNNLLKTK